MLLKASTYMMCVCVEGGGCLCIGNKVWVLCIFFPLILEKKLIGFKYYFIIFNSSIILLFTLPLQFFLVKSKLISFRKIVLFIPFPPTYPFPHSLVAMETTPCSS